MCEGAALRPVPSSLAMADGGSSHPRDGSRARVPSPEERGVLLQGGEVPGG